MGTNDPTKFIIGLTGNIGSGKSLVLKMLEQKGAYIIDADAVSRRVMMKDAPAYQPVLDAFGRYILGADGEIDRPRLGRTVFGDPAALQLLESIVHPYVREAISTLVETHTGPEEVLVIEAIKLLEGPLKDLCDAIWVVTVPQETAIRRLQKRGLPEAEARQRLQAQGPDDAKLEAANLVIDNNGTPSDTWKQVSEAYNVIIEVRQRHAAMAAESPLRRYRPTEMQQLAEFINAAAGEEHAFVPSDDRAFYFLKKEGETQAVVSWYAENFIARATNFFALPSLDAPARQQAMQTLLAAIEKEAAELRCEVLLLAVPAGSAEDAAALQNAGYFSKPLNQLGVRAWGDAARALKSDDGDVLIKQLGTERVLKPLS